MNYFAPKSKRGYPDSDARADVRLFDPGGREAQPALPAQQRFLDVFPASVFYPFVDHMAARAITVGCNPPTSNLYCPSDVVTREQMAAFIVRAFGL